MSRKTINTIILGIFFLFFVLLIYINVKPQPRVHHARVATLVKADRSGSGPSADIETVTRTGQYDPESLMKQFGRDPFAVLFAAEDEKPVKKGESDGDQAAFADPTNEEPLQVSVIILTKHNRSAVINGQRYSEGDVIGKNTTVSSIQEGGVVFAAEDKRWFVPLRDSTITIQKKVHPERGRYDENIMD